jgi:hypothetical protein
VRGQPLYTTTSRGSCFVVIFDDCPSWYMYQTCWCSVSALGTTGSQTASCRTSTTIAAPASPRRALMTSEVSGAVCIGPLVVHVARLQSFTLWMPCLCRRSFLHTISYDVHISPTAHISVRHIACWARPNSCFFGQVSVAKQSNTAKWGCVTHPPSKKTSTLFVQRFGC